MAATSSCLSIREKVTALILSNGPLSFPDFLGVALYDPEYGYYASNTHQVGREGDFFTSVSVGPLFGQLLARRFLNWWENHGKPDSWRILEIGAHDGKLAADILATMAQLSPAAWQALEYAILEPLPRLREAQQNRLAPLAAKLHLVSEIDSLPVLPGIVFGNEILDALPFHLVRRCEGEWRELHVAEGFEWIAQPIAAESDLDKKLRFIPGDLPEGYQTEIRTNYQKFLNEVSKAISDGLLLFIDYGFAAPEYYDVYRTTGTLRTFSKHQAAEDPLDNPGQKDITAHVDFTDLARVAVKLGWHPAHFSSQGSYLTHLAAAMIQQGGMDDPKIIAQLRTLTHPAHLGASFHVIEFEKSIQTTPQVLHRLALL